MFSKELNKKLDRYHLLTHPFYQVFWNEGKLTREIIKDYAEQYYQHVKAFPRYISATHSMCDEIEKRKTLLENLQHEEISDGDHPKLWKNFAAAMGADKSKIDEYKAGSQFIIEIHWKFHSPHFYHMRCCPGFAEARLYFL